jgi:hypothetical protein
MDGERMPLARGLIKRDNLDASDTVLIDIQTAWELTHDLYDGVKNLGPVKLPYPNMFMEWKSSTIRHDVIGVPLSGDMGFEVDEHTRDGEPAIRLILFVMHSSGKPGVVPYPAVIKLDDQGFISDDSIYFESKDDYEGVKPWYDNDEYDEEEQHQVKLVLSKLLVSVLVALSLMNCKNVTVERLGSIKMRRSGTEKRRGLKPYEVRYNTIVLPGGGSQKVGTGNRAHHRVTALHRVRGHVKTFTAEAPLLGKHVGTYWWGWQVRGDSDKGIVDSDYVLAEPKG